MGYQEYASKLQEWYGYNEARGQDDIIIDIYNRQKVESYKMSHNDPWCHATVSAAAYASGNSGKVPNTAYCPNGINWFKNRGKWVSRWSRNYSPVVGDIIYYDWGGDGVSDHVGTVISVNGDVLTVREGNKNDMLCDRSISKWSSLIQGYGRPDWGGVTTPIGTVPQQQKPYGNIKNSGVIKTGQQHSINFTNHSIAVDGIPGVETKKQKVRVLQHAMNCDYRSGLSVDGIFGSKTSAALGNHYVRNGETQYMVTAWEILLMLNGYDPKGVECPGEFGSGCLAATKQFQKDHGLVVDGVAGRKSFLTAING